MVVSNPHEVPEYELNPLELQVRRVDGIWKACSFFPSLLSSSIAINVLPFIHFNVKTCCLDAYIDSEMFI